MPSDTLTILCPAKINLALSVGAPREDGMHPISSWMTLIDLCDILTLSRCRDGTGSLKIGWGDHAPVKQVVDWPIESDLTYRAHALLQEYVGRALPVDAALVKNIPAGAGLGGGSGNAAGMLTGLNTLFKLGLDTGELGALGLELGSDVMFMTLADAHSNLALVQGIGDELALADCQVPLDIVLILPEVACSTAKVYQEFDRITQSEHGQSKRGRVKTYPLDQVLKTHKQRNDLTDAAFTVQPGLLKIRDKIQALTDNPVHLSGSGSAMFILMENREKSETLAKLIKEQTGVTAIRAASLTA